MSDHGHSTQRIDPALASALKLEEAATNPGGLNAPLIAFVGGVGVVLVFVIMVATEAWFYGQQTMRNETDRFTVRNSVIESYHVEQSARLNEVRWLDHNKAKLSVPIDKAAEAFLADEAFRKFAAAGPAPKAD